MGAAAEALLDSGEVGGKFCRRRPLPVFPVPMPVPVLVPALAPAPAPGPWPPLWKEPKRSSAADAAMDSSRSSFSSALSSARMSSAVRVLSGCPLRARGDGAAGGGGGGGRGWRGPSVPSSSFSSASTPSDESSSSRMVSSTSASASSSTGTSSCATGCGALVPSGRASALSTTAATGSEGRAGGALRGTEAWMARGDGVSARSLSALAFPAISASSRSFIFRNRATNAATSPDSDQGSENCARIDQFAFGGGARARACVPPSSPLPCIPIHRPERSSGVWARTTRRMRRTT